MAIPTATTTSTYQVIVVPSGVTWTQADSMAEAMGGYLATITTFAENVNVLSLLDDSSYWTCENGQTAIGPWIGGFQPPGTGEPSSGWQWVTGEPWSFTAWGAGQPNNTITEEDCLHYYRPGSCSLFDGEWNDYPNTGQVVLPISFVVEFEGTPVPALPVAWMAVLVVAVLSLAVLFRRTP